MSRGIFIVVLVAAALGARAERVAITGTRVTIERPEGFHPSPDFPGLVDPDNRSVIRVAEVPTPFIDLSQSYSNANLRLKGLTIVSRDSLETEGLRAELLRGEQSLGRTRVVKWIYISGDVNESVSITATYAIDHDAALRPRVEKALRSIVWESSRDVDHFEGLTYNLRAVPGLRVATRISNSILFTRGGRLPDKYYTGPLLIAGRTGFENEPPLDGRAFARSQFENISILAEASIDQIEPMSLGALSGFEITGTGRHRHLGYPVSVLQAIVFDDNGFFMAQGFTETRKHKKHYNLFRTVIGSFRQTE